MDFRAVVFDMDGVIFDTEKLYRKYQLLEGEKEEYPLKQCTGHVRGLREAISSQTKSPLRI